MANTNSQSRRAPTTYGTTSLNTDDQLERATQRRRNVMRYGVTGLTIAAGLSLIGYGYARHSSASVTVATGDAPPPSASSTTPAGQVGVVVPPAVAGASIECWQSSYVNGEFKMMEPISGLTWSSAAKETPSSVITVDGSKKFQEIFGFGGAFTEAAGLQFQKLPADKQEEVLSLYFDKQHGSGYTFGRVPMGSCDFSVASYNFDNVTGDVELVHFDDTVEADTRVIIPFIQRAKAKVPELKLFLAPWSPPGWMKRTDDKYSPASMVGSATPNGLRDDYRKPWANYFSRFISAYKSHGLPFWGLTPQNEPEFAAPWEACGYNASYQAEFVAEYLGPVMKRDHPEVKIMVFDHNRASVLQWAETIFNHEGAKKYVDGIAIHWYDDERYMDGVEFHERVNDTHYVDESRFILATESCNCPGIATGDDAWFRAQRYAHDILTDMNNWVVGWVDWNLILDHTGGPNHLGNNCDAPIVLTEDGKDFKIQPMYYFIQHISKFVPPGSRRISTTVAAQFDKPGDAQLFVRYPAALHSCDGSSRQKIHVTEDSKLQVTGTDFCLDLIRPQWIGRQVQLVKCIYTAQKWTFVNGQIRMDNHCLQLHKGSTLNSARVTTGHCIDNAEADHQKWQFSNGHMNSFAAPEKCVTAGFAFVQSASFITPENKKVTVVLNENTEDANFELQYGNASVATTVPRGAIRTFTWD